MWVSASMGPLLALSLAFVGRHALLEVFAGSLLELRVDQTLLPQSVVSCVVAAELELVLVWLGVGSNRRFSQRSGLSPGRLSARLPAPFKFCSR
jgi:hypothetical protein